MRTNAQVKSTARPASPNSWSSACSDMTGEPLAHDGGELGRGSRRVGQRERDPELLVLRRPQLVEGEHVDTLDVAEAGGDRGDPLDLAGMVGEPRDEHVADPDPRTPRSEPLGELERRSQ